MWCSILRNHVLSCRVLWYALFFLRIFYCILSAIISSPHSHLPLILGRFHSGKNHYIIKFVVYCSVMSCLLLFCSVMCYFVVCVLWLLPPSKRPKKNQYSVVNESNPKSLDIQKDFDIFSLNSSNRTSTFQEVSCIHLYPAK